MEILGKYLAQLFGLACTYFRSNSQAFSEVIQSDTIYYIFFWYIHVNQESTSTSSICRSWDFLLSTSRVVDLEEHGLDRSRVEPRGMARLGEATVRRGSGRPGEGPAGFWWEKGGWPVEKGGWPVDVGC